MLTESHRVRVSALALVIALGCLSCAGSTDCLPVDETEKCFRCDSSACTQPLELTFLGSAGFVLQRGTDVILLDPFFSNPSIATVAFGAVRSNTKAVREGMKSVPRPAAILVGHAHYDHLLDVPEVVGEMTPAPPIYASETAKNVLHAYRVSAEALDAKAWSPGSRVSATEMWTAIAGTRVRFLAIRSEHAPHVLGYTFMRGGYADPLVEPPCHAICWREGMTLAFVIDFLATDGSTDFRVLFHDSAARPGVGLPPLDLPLARVHVAIPCVASFAQVDHYPATLIDGFAPDYVVLGHWEDFFTPYSQRASEVRSVRGTKVNEFITELRRKTNAPFSMPLPGVKTRIASACSDER